jgi:hypothetical protein
MNHGQITARLFAVIDAETKADLLDNISEHYGITQAEALAEVTDDEAEHLLDYVTGPAREAVSVLIQKHRLDTTSSAPPAVRQRHC